MGIPPIPPEYVPGAGCTACFPTGQTPKYVWVTITGSGPGPFWTPFFPSSPNGTYKLTFTANCQWSAPFGNGSITYGCAWPGSTVIIRVWPYMNEYIGSNIMNCITGFSMEVDPAFPEFWLPGSAAVSFSDPDA
jgi:hypothetical protein